MCTDFSLTIIVLDVRRSNSIDVLFDAHAHVISLAELHQECALDRVTRLADIAWRHPSI
jgi:hypothetical protein